LVKANFASGAIGSDGGQILLRKAKLERKYEFPANGLQIPFASRHPPRPVFLLPPSRVHSRHVDTFGGVASYNRQFACLLENSTPSLRCPNYMYGMKTTAPVEYSG
jgi:hypothetical protein